MDSLTFIASLVNATVWPLSIFIFLLLFRVPLTEIIKGLADKISNIKFPGGEVNFHQGVDSVSEIASEANLQVGPQTGEDAILFGTERERFTRLATSSPSSAVVEAWRDLEWALRDAFERLHIPSSKHPPAISHMIRSLAKRDVLNPDTAAIVHELRMLRNAVLHQRNVQISVGDAIEYSRLAQSVIFTLRQVSE